MKVKFLIMVFLLTLASHGHSGTPAALVQPVCKGGKFLGLVLMPISPQILEIQIDLETVCKGRSDNVPEGFGTDREAKPPAPKKGPQA